MTNIASSIVSKAPRAARKGKVVPSIVASMIDTGAQHDAHVSARNANLAFLSHLIDAPSHEQALTMHLEDMMQAPLMITHLPSLDASTIEAALAALEGEVVTSTPFDSASVPALTEGVYEGVYEGVQDDMSDEDEHALRVSAYHAALMQAFDERTQYQLRKDAGNESMQKALKGMRAGLNHDRIAEVMMLARCDANKINRTENSDATRYNIYAYQKDINIARCIATPVEKLNHYTLAIFQSIRNLHDAGMKLTQGDAYSAVKKSQKVDPAKRAYIVKYTHIDVTSGTMTTQASSSLNALQSFDIIREVSKSVFVFNPDAPASKVLIERLAA